MNIFLSIYFGPKHHATYYIHKQMNILFPNIGLLISTTWHFLSVYYNQHILAAFS